VHGTVASKATLQNSAELIDISDKKAAEAEQNHRASGSNSGDEVIPCQAQRAADSRNHTHETRATTRTQSTYALGFAVKRESLGTVLLAMAVHAQLLRTHLPPQHQCTQGRVHRLLLVP